MGKFTGVLLASDYDNTLVNSEAVRLSGGDAPEISPKNEEDRRLWACNKWLLAHRESSEAAQGAPVLLEGVNLDIGELLP